MHAIKPSVCARSSKNLLMLSVDTAQLEQELPSLQPHPQPPNHEYRKSVLQVEVGRISEPVV